MRILINSPYTKEWIQLSCEIISTIMEENKHTKIFIVIPVWNKSDRKKLNLSDNADLQQINGIKKSKYLIYHNMLNLEFYNGLTKIYIYLKDKVHLFIFKNY